MTELRHLMDELKLLRKEVEHNRKHILKQDGELRAVKLELEEVKKHCRCEPNTSEEKSESEMNKVSSGDKTSYNLSWRQSKIRTYLFTELLPRPVMIKWRLVFITGKGFGGLAVSDQLQLDRYCHCLWTHRENCGKAHNQDYGRNSHNGPISFYAYMSSAMNHVGGHHTLIFNVIVSNQGQGLSRTTGVFRAPQSGFYVFTWTIRVLNYSIQCVELIVNGQSVGSLVSQTLKYNGTGSTTVVVHVNEGEDVFLRTMMQYNKGAIYSDPYGYTSFAGWNLSCVG